MVGFLLDEEGCIRLSRNANAVMHMSSTVKNALEGLILDARWKNMLLMLADANHYDGCIIFLCNTQELSGVIVSNFSFLV